MLLGGTLLLAGIASSTTAFASPGANDAATIEYLINYVRQSDMLFVRNFSKHKPDSAASHIQKKYDHFLDEIDSPEEFIELCATKSLMTGRDYNVVDPEGNKVKTRDWLLSALKAYRTHQ